MTVEAWIAVIAIGVTVVLTIIGGLCGIIIMLIKRNADGTNRQRDDQGQTLTRTAERNQDRTVDTAIDLSAMQANVNTLMADRGKCDELGHEVAVLKDFKVRAEAKLDEVDEASRELRGMAEQMRTVFHTLEAMPEAITNRVLSRIPQVVRDTLEAARAMPQGRNSANG